MVVYPWRTILLGSRWMSTSLAFLIGTSRNDGNTWKLLNQINAQFQAPIVDLGALNISFFDYQSRNLNDDFIPTIESLTSYSTIGFVSPMYWYSVSAQMKVFIDRLSDLLGPRKDLGRMLRDKRTFLLANGSSEPQITAGMEEVIGRTSEYLGMRYQGSFYARLEEGLAIDAETVRAATEFVDRVARA